MDCTPSRDSIPYKGAVIELTRSGMVYPGGLNALQRQSFSMFTDVLEMAYCLDAFEACKKAYSLALQYHGEHKLALKSMYSEGWRVMFWYGQRIRIVNINNL